MRYVMKAQVINRTTTSLENFVTIIVFALLIIGGIAFNVVAAILTGLLFGVL